MRPITAATRAALIATCLALSVAGCDDAEKKPAPAPKADVGPAAGKRVAVGPGVTLEIIGGKRRVLVDAEVCLREGPLEQLMTRKGQKEHEAVLAADVDARKVHEALLLANAKEGTTVKWLPKYKAPTGTPIRISLAYTQKGKRVVVNARSWLQNMKTKAELDTDWVFAGSMLVDNPLDTSKNPAKHYLANDGDVICVSNFESAMLDIPTMSSKADGDRGWVAWSDRIPPVGTKVQVILEPVVAEKK